MLRFKNIHLDEVTLERKTEFINLFEKSFAKIILSKFLIRFSS